MKKRNLIAILIIVAITGSLSTLFTSCKTGKNIGLQLYSIRDSITKDVPAAIEKVAKMGYKFVEPAGYRDGMFYGMDPAAFKELCDKNGLPVLSSHSSRPLPDETNYAET
ncbi:MAG TPA: sugar phosphate isomerase, partial [Bacteroidales bacterium]|nr:sugar phosphate isomerase [Bacteroidales bacterium]